MTIAKTLSQREARYGDFSHHAEIAQSMQDTARACEGWGRLDPVKRQAMTVIMDKLARVLSGDPNYADNWHDIQGYAKLVEDRLPKPEEPADALDDELPLVSVAHAETCAERRLLYKQAIPAKVAGVEPPIDPGDVDIFDTDEDSTGTLLLNPANWEAGDVLVCVVQGDSVRYGEKYVYTGDSDDANEYMVEVQPLDGGRVLAGQRYANRFRFHSRPTK